MESSDVRQLSCTEKESPVQEKVFDRTYLLWEGMSYRRKHQRSPSTDLIEDPAVSAWYFLESIQICHKYTVDLTPEFRQTVIAISAIHFWIDTCSSGSDSWAHHMQIVRTSQLPIEILIFVLFMLVGMICYHDVYIIGISSDVILTWV